MSRKVAKLIRRIADVTTCWQKPKRRAATLAEASSYLLPRLQVETPHGPLVFEGPTVRALHDPANLLSDEPETLAWIDTLDPGSVLWDIGANVGTYALYAAKRGHKVLAFEPSAATYAVLIRNIELNAASDAVSAYCLAFDETSHLDGLYMANTGAGHSMHAFGQSHTVKGNIEKPFVQPVLGFSIDDFIGKFSPPFPSHIKLDVDSIEEKILRGAKQTLAKTDSVLVEIDGETRDSGGQAIRALLEGAGLREQQDFCKNARRNVLFRRPA